MQSKTEEGYGSLFITKQQAGEKVGVFFERFKAEMRYVNCEPQCAAIAFREGLFPGAALFENLIRNPPKNMDNVLTRVEGEIRLERAREIQEARVIDVIALRECEKNATMQNHQNKESPQDYPHEEWFTIHPVTIYKRHCHEDIFKKPSPQPEAGDEVEKNRYCPLHDARGHGIYKCQGLRNAIRVAMKNGKLL